MNDGKSFKIDCVANPSDKDEYSFLQNYGTARNEMFLEIYKAEIWISHGKYCFETTSNVRDIKNVLFPP